MNTGMCNDLLNQVIRPQMMKLFFLFSDKGENPLYCWAFTCAMLCTGGFRYASNHFHFDGTKHSRVLIHSNSALTSWFHSQHFFFFLLRSSAHLWNQAVLWWVNIYRGSCSQCVNHCELCIMPRVHVIRFLFSVAVLAAFPGTYVQSDIRLNGDTQAVS